MRLWSPEIGKVALTLKKKRKYPNAPADGTYFIRGARDEPPIVPEMKLASASDAAGTYVFEFEPGEYPEPQAEDYLMLRLPAVAVEDPPAAADATTILAEKYYPFLVSYIEDRLRENRYYIQTWATLYSHPDPLGNHKVNHDATRRWILSQVVERTPIFEKVLRSHLIMVPYVGRDVLGIRILKTLYVVYLAVEGLG